MRQRASHGLGPAITCAGCGQHRPHKARGMCRPCYNRGAWRGDVADLAYDGGWYIRGGVWRPYVTGGND